MFRVWDRHFVKAISVIINFCIRSASSTIHFILFIRKQSNKRFRKKTGIGKKGIACQVFFKFSTSTRFVNLINNLIFQFPITFTLDTSWRWMFRIRNKNRHFSLTYTLHFMFAKHSGYKSNNLEETNINFHCCWKFIDRKKIEKCTDFKKTIVECIRKKKLLLKT